MTNDSAAREVALRRGQEAQMAREADEARQRARQQGRETEEARRRARDAEATVRHGRGPARARVSQADVPTWTLRDVLPIAHAVHRRGGLDGPVTPDLLASDLDESVASAAFRTKTAASVAYGLTDGGAQADGVSLTGLGRRIVMPTGRHEAHAALVEALTRPRMLGSLLAVYSDRPWPPGGTLRRHLLEEGYAEQAVDRAVEVIDRNVRELGLVAEAAPGKAVLTLRPPAPPAPQPEPPQVWSAPADLIASGVYARAAGSAAQAGDSPSRPAPPLHGRERVYLSTPPGSPLLAEVAEVLSFGGYLPVAPPEQAADATSLEVIERMRTCTAAVIGLSTDPAHPGELDSQSLVRIGAALALCGDKAVFLCPDGLAMPRAYEHLRHIRHEGVSLDRESTMALLRTFNSIRGAW